MEEMAEVEKVAEMEAAETAVETEAVEKAGD